MGTKVIGCALLLGAFLVAPVTASAWSCIDASCPAWCATTVQYQIGDTPPSLDEAMVIAEIQRAADTWNAVDCADITLEYAGRIADGVVDGAIQIDWPATWTMGAGAINIGTAMWGASGCITSGGITNDLPDYTWVIDRTMGDMAVDVYTLHLAAFGRVLGLGNSDDAMSPLYPAYNDMLTGLSADDEMGLCALYGDGSVPVMPGDGSSCTRCTANTDCDSNVCIAFPTGGARCGAPCTGDGECIDGATCTEVGAGGSICADTSGASPICGFGPSTTSDAGVADAGSDAGPGDGGIPADVGDYIDADTDSGTPSGGDDGGCGCSTPSRRTHQGTGLFLGGLALLLVVRSRRRGISRGD